MRITRPFVLLALAVLMAPRIEASRTSVWESNPPAATVLARADATSALASLAPAAAADEEAEEPPHFDLGDVALVDSELEHEDRFGLGPLDLLGPTPLRGPPSSYPETRVGGFELLPSFRVGASASLSLWSRQACGFVCREVASDSRYDPWGLSEDCSRAENPDSCRAFQAISSRLDGERAQLEATAPLPSSTGSAANAPSGLISRASRAWNRLWEGMESGWGKVSSLWRYESKPSALQLEAGDERYRTGPALGAAMADLQEAGGRTVLRGTRVYVEGKAIQLALSGAVAAGTVAQNLAKGTAAEIAAMQRATGLGEVVIQSQFRRGAADRGIDFLSFSGTGADARLFINEVKAYDSGVVARRSFTALGQGKSGIGTFQLNLAKAEQAIRNAGLDVVTEQTLVDQLVYRRARIRLIGNTNSVFQPATMEEIGKSTGFLVGEGFRVP